MEFVRRWNDGSPVNGVGVGSGSAKNKTSQQPSQSESLSSAYNPFFVRSLNHSITRTQPFPRVTVKQVERVDDKTAGNDSAREDDGGSIESGGSPVPQWNFPSTASKGSSV